MQSDNQRHYQSNDQAYSYDQDYYRHKDRRNHQYGYSQEQMPQTSSQEFNPNQQNVYFPQSSQEFIPSHQM
jgi:hypothetical protein